jgi:hypothetical protein
MAIAIIALSHGTSFALVSVEQNPRHRGWSLTSRGTIMAESLKDKAERAGRKVAEKASEIGHEVSEKMDEAKDWVKEKARQVAHPNAVPLSESEGTSGSTSDIREHMSVYASCGTYIGKVDHVEGDRIKLTKNDSIDGHHHRIPLSWVAKVHDHIYLKKDHKQVESEWQTA